MVANVSWLNESSAFEMNAIFHSLNSLLPQFILDSFAENVCASTIVVGNLPGPSHSVSICGRKVLEKYILGGLQFKHTSELSGAV